MLFIYFSFSTSMPSKHPSGITLCLSFKYHADLPYTAKSKTNLSVVIMLCLTGIYYIVYVYVNT